MSISFEQTVIAPSSQAVSCDIGGETVILDLASGQYFALDPVGTQIWQWLAEPCTAASICDRLLAEYDVSPAECRSQVSQLLDQLANHGLLKTEARGAVATALAE